MIQTFKFTLLANYKKARKVVCAGNAQNAAHTFPPAILMAKDLAQTTGTTLTLLALVKEIVWIRMMLEKRKFRGNY